MNEFDPIRNFLAELRKKIATRPESTERILDEVEDHLLEKASRLHQQGYAPDAARREALARFGSPDELARRFYLEGAPPTEGNMLLRTGITLLSGFTALVGLVIGLYSLFIDTQESQPAWVAQKVTGGMAIVAVGAFTLCFLWRRGSKSRSLSKVLWVAGLLLVPWGLLTIAGTVLLARATGDWEFYMIAAGVALMSQGVLTLAYLRQQSLTPA